MRPSEDIKKLIDNLNDTTSAEMDARVLGHVLSALEESEKTSARSQPNIRRTIMKNPITKLAVAATVIVVAILGLSEFIGTENKSGVVWAEVARKVETSQGLIVRCTETTSFMPSDNDYSIKYFSPTHSRTDSYKGGLITDCYYTDIEAKTYTGVHHTRKHYLSVTIAPSDEGFLEKQEDWMNPRYLVQKILSCQHAELGQKTIDGVLCEGLETTDPAVFDPLPGPVDRLDVHLRLWVNAETQYPVLFEWKVNAEAEGQAVESEAVMDQFQWDVELDSGIFEPNIPPDYVDMRNL